MEQQSRLSLTKHVLHYVNAIRSVNLLIWGLQNPPFYFITVYIVKTLLVKFQQNYHLMEVNYFYELILLCLFCSSNLTRCL